MTHLLVQLGAPVAQDAPSYTFDNLKPGPWALLVTLLLVLALVLLLRSMRRQLRKIRFDPNATSDAERARSREEPRQD